MEEAIVPPNRLHFIKASTSDGPRERRENEARRERRRPGPSGAPPRHRRRAFHGKQVEPLAGNLSIHSFISLRQTSEYRDWSRAGVPEVIKGDQDALISTISTSRFTSGHRMFDASGKRRL